MQSDIQISTLLAKIPDSPIVFVMFIFMVE